MLLIYLPMGWAISQDAAILFQNANTLYQEGSYAEAAALYHEIEQMDMQSGQLFYNLGNCYYKLDQIGKSVLYYERARLLIPNDEALLFNLDLTALKVVDKITPREDFILSRIFRNVIYLLPRIWHLRIMLALYIVLMSALILWILSRSRRVRVAAFRVSTLLAIVALAVLILFIARLRHDAQSVEAVIMADKVDVMSAPGGEGVDLFSLHEGTKVRIDNKTDQWVEIVLADGKVGWVIQSVLEEI